MLLNEAINVFDAIGALLNKEIAVSLTFRLDKITATLQPEVTRFFNARNELVKKNGEQVEEESADKAPSYKLSPEAQVLINKEVDSMLATEIVFPEEYKIPIKLLENISMEGKMALNLKPIIKD